MSENFTDCEICGKIKLEYALCPFCNCHVSEGEYGGLMIKGSRIYCNNCMRYISGVCNPNLCKKERERRERANSTGSSGNSEPLTKNEIIASIISIVFFILFIYFFSLRKYF